MLGNRVAKHGGALKIGMEGVAAVVFLCHYRWIAFVCNVFVKLNVSVDLVGGSDPVIYLVSQLLLAKALKGQVLCGKNGAEIEFCPVFMGDITAFSVAVDQLGIGWYISFMPSSIITLSTPRTCFIDISKRSTADKPILLRGR